MRPTVDRYATDNRPIYHRHMTDIRSRCVYEISTDTRPIVHRSLDRLATEYRPTLDRHSTASRPTIDRLSIDYRPTLDRLLTDYRSTIDRYIDRLSTDIAVDITSTLPTVNMIPYFNTVVMLIASQSHIKVIH